MKQARQRISVATLSVIAAIALFPVASPVFGQTGPQIFAVQERFDATSLKPSSLRRLRFYADKARAALFDLARADTILGTEGDQLAQSATRALRKSVERMIDAGIKAKLTLGQTAAFFAQDLREQYSGQLPLVVLDEQGNLNTGLLFQGVNDARASLLATEDKDYINYVTQMGNEVDASLNEGQGATPAPAPQPVATVAAAPQRDPAVQAYWDRLQERGGKRYIKVRAGDTLATFASVFYGDALLYRKIFNANKQIVSSPNLLEVDKLIEIPQ